MASDYDELGVQEWVVIPGRINRQRALKEKCGCVAKKGMMTWTRTNTPTDERMYCTSP